MRCSGYMLRNTQGFIKTLPPVQYHNSTTAAATGGRRRITSLVAGRSSTVVDGGEATVARSE
nr:hypothetical protein Iba_chr04eCG7150 [Ipomoea batatas]